VLEIEDLHVSYGAVAAVRGISLSLNEGESVALLGPNGAGKSSTLRAISGLCAYEGSIRFEGREVRSTKAEMLSRAGLIHVPEGRRLFASLSVHENLTMGTIALGKRTPVFTIDDVYDLFPALVRLRDRESWSLSGGEQQMVALGRAFVAGPRVLMLDEPSLGLAPILVTAVFDALTQVKDRVPILLVEQNTTKSLALCARGAVLVDGGIALEGSSEQLSDRRALLDSYLGQEEIDEVASES